jgi:hypothetical protein
MEFISLPIITGREGWVSAEARVGGRVLEAFSTNEKPGTELDRVSSPDKRASDSLGSMGCGARELVVSSRGRAGSDPVVLTLPVSNPAWQFNRFICPLERVSV